MSAYRTPAPVVPMPVARHRGPRDKCAACGCLVVPERAYKLALVTRACRGASWIARLFGACAERSLHLHQRCLACGATWECEPIESIT